MRAEQFLLKANDGAEIHVHRWLPDGADDKKKIGVAI